MKILGFDISSSCTAYSVLNFDESGVISFESCSYINPIKTGNIIERLSNTRDKIKLIIDTVKPDYIGIEDLIKFMPKSTATTVVTLASFNRMICLLCHDYLKKSPELLNVLSIRHGLKFEKIFPKKEEMPELVAKHLGITFPYEKNKKGKNKIENFDMADAIAVSLYYAFVLTGKNKKAKKDKKKSKKNEIKRSIPSNGII